MQQNLTYKILQAHTPERITEAGQIVQCRVDMVLANDITGPLAIRSFQGMGAKKVFDKDKIALVMDHFTPQKDIDSANQVRISRKFAEEQNLTHYFEGGDCGVEHTLLPELGLARPGDLIVGADSHTCTYGGIGAFATGMGSTDIAAAMALGETWLKVPPVIRVIYEGELGEDVSAKDLMLTLIGLIGVDGALYQGLEFVGSVIDKLPIEGRLTMANMAIEAGAKTGIFPIDDLLRKWCAAEGHPTDLRLEADKDAVYARTVEIDVSGLEPVVACPHIPSNVKKVSSLPPTEIHQVVIGSCTNGRYSDLEAAAKVLKGRKVKKGVRCIILPSTPKVWKKALRDGLIEIFMDSGCIVGPATCGPCLGG
ncbi:MAG: 3-isopropylmalate dehydratase large subunit, partial [Desulfovibrio sp.]|nr:3-isopropylmalate dehydratase large subunit [Desulfovibrio sp.]